MCVLVIFIYFLYIYKCVKRVCVVLKSATDLNAPKFPTEFTVMCSDPTTGPQQQRQSQQRAHQPSSQSLCVRMDFQLLCACVVQFM